MSSTNRYLSSWIQKEALNEHKIAFLSGPRQVGKTTLAQALLHSPQRYFNWDDSRFRKIWSKDPRLMLDTGGEGVFVLDEIHKDRAWKSKIKGIYDLDSHQNSFLVTGSARMDVFRKGSDSLLGRYLPFRLHPFTVGEYENTQNTADEVFQFKRKVQYPIEDLLALGGFPEPLFKGNQNKAARWSDLRRDRIVFEDFRDFRASLDLQQVRVLTDLILLRASQKLSINSLREDMRVAYATVRDWVQVLESLYYCFTIRPYSEKISRSIMSEPKVYFYDIIPIEDDGARFENLVALHLLKAVQFWTDTAQGRFDLFYVRTKEDKEVDFLVTKNKKPWCLVECKQSGNDVSPGLIYFKERLKTEHNFQLVRKPNTDKNFISSGIRMMSAEQFLAQWV